jgi:hypothetical protein
MADDPQEDGGGDEADVPESEPHTLSYAPAGLTNLKTLRKLPAFEANLAAAKLEAAGVRCFVADQNISVAHPLLFGEVRLQVAEADLDRAEEILATPSEVSDDEEEDDGEKDEDGGYVEEAYRCPRCRRKEVDLLPLSTPMRHARLGCLAVALFGVLTWLIPEAAHSIGGYPPAVVMAWVAVLGTFSVIVLTAKRNKRCRECGHEWGNEPV